MEDINGQEVDPFLREHEEGSAVEQLNDARCSVRAARLLTIARLLPQMKRLQLIFTFRGLHDFFAHSSPPAGFSVTRNGICHEILYAASVAASSVGRRKLIFIKSQSQRKKIP